MRSAAAVRWCGHATVGNDEASSRNGEEEETEAEGGAQASAPIRSRRRSGPSVFIGSLKTNKKSKSIQLSKDALLEL
uniref:Uncharacterized protein n=1 Tax=Oryza glumipatula TaxID=40148 RepID=A0A0D9YWJ6_9ORYZ